MLPGLEGFFGQHVVGVNRRGDHHGFDVGLEQLGVAAEKLYLRVVPPYEVEPLELGVRDRDELCVRHLVQVPDELRTPVPTTDDPDLDPSPLRLVTVEGHIGHVTIDLRPVVARTVRAADCYCHCDSPVKGS